MDDQQQAEVAFWVSQYAVALENLRDSTVEAILRLLSRFTAYYEPSSVRDFAEQAVALSEFGQQAVEGLSNRYIVNVHQTMVDKPTPAPRVQADPVRNGVDPVQVYTRPIETYQRKLSTTGDEAEALAQMVERTDRIVRTDLTLVARDVERQTMEKLGVGKYRRVLHPELSKTGACGLCIAASTRVYKIKELLPLHVDCRCTVVEIGTAGDPGQVLNVEDLKSFYGAAGGTAGQKLRRTRYKVNEHGEYGPALSSHGQVFNTPTQIGEKDPIGRAVAELAKLKPTLKLLQDKAAAGQDVSGPLAYQLDRIAFLERIIGDAA